jgi:LCCL domain
VRVRAKVAPLPACRSGVTGKGAKLHLHRVRPRSRGQVCALISVLLALSAAAATLTPVPAVHDVDWGTSPLDLNLRGLNGERFRFHCPPGTPRPGQVIGSGPYTDGSSICAAAVHAGVINAASGGVVTIEIRPGEAHYAASSSHFIQSEGYERFWSGSFLVIALESAEMRAPPSPSHK